jgi:hypothetical protein
MGYARYYAEAGTPTPLPDLDPRWLDAAVNAGAGAVELVCDLARPGHAAANSSSPHNSRRTKQPHEALEVLRTMVRIRHPDAADSLIAALKNMAKDTPHYYYLSYWYGPMIADMPRSELPKFEALIPTLPDKMVDQLMESLLALKNKPDEA